MIARTGFSLALGIRSLAVAAPVARSALFKLRVPARTMAAAAEETLFEKIVAGKIPCTKVYEDDIALAFRDISPTAPTHVILIPKVKGRLTQLQHATEEDKATLGHLLWAAGEVARKEGLGEGYRVVINDGPKGCQSVYHLHLHVIGGKQLTWPPGTGAPEGSMKA